MFNLTATAQMAKLTVTLRHLRAGVTGVCHYTWLHNVFGNNCTLLHPSATMSFISAMSSPEFSPSTFEHLTLQWACVQWHLLMDLTCISLMIPDTELL